MIPGLKGLILPVRFSTLSNDINVVDQAGNTALHVAATSSKTECIRVLLRAGATDSLNIGRLTTLPTRDQNVSFEPSSLNLDSASSTATIQADSR